MGGFQGFSPKHISLLNQAYQILFTKKPTLTLGLNAKWRGRSEALGRHPTPWRSGGLENHMENQAFAQEKTWGSMRERSGELLKKVVTT